MTNKQPGTDGDRIVIDRVNEVGNFASVRARKENVRHLCQARGIDAEAFQSLVINSTEPFHDYLRMQPKLRNTADRYIAVFEALIVHCPSTRKEVEKVRAQLMDELGVNSKVLSQMTVGTALKFYQFLEFQLMQENNTQNRLMGKTLELNNEDVGKVAARLDMWLRSPGVNRYLPGLQHSRGLSGKEMEEVILKNVTPFEAYLKIHNKQNQLSPESADMHYAVFVALIIAAPTPKDEDDIRKKLKKYYNLRPQELYVILQRSCLKFYNFLVEQL